MWSFTSKAKVDYTFGVIDHDRDISLVTREVPLKWTLELELREYGVKSFYITVPDQVIELEFEENIYDEDDNHVDTKYTTKEIELKDIKTEFKVPEMSEQMYFGLFPSEIEIYKNTFTARFA